jgi:hypothetical protein
MRAIAGLTLLVALILSVQTLQAPVSASRTVMASPGETLVAQQPSPTLRPHYTATPEPTSTPTAASAAASDKYIDQADVEVDPAMIEQPPAETPVPLPLNYRFTPQEDDIVTHVARGVVHIQRYTNDPLHINVLLFDLTAPEFDIKTALGDDWISGRTRTSYMVRQNQALAGVNGDLFHGVGEPQGLTIIDSRVAMPPKHRATFAWTQEREPIIGYFTDGWTWNAQLVAANGEEVTLNEYNQRCRLDHICLYNDFYRYLPPDWRDVKVLVGPSGRVFDIVEGEAMSISGGMQVYQGLGEGAAWLLENVEVGDTLTLNVATDRPIDNLTQAISGGPIIVQEGRFTEDCMCQLFDCSEAIAAGYYTYTEAKEEMPLCEDFNLYWKETHYGWSYMPRTGVGYDRWKQTLIVAVVDGYQPGFSRGMLQEEFADLMIEFGAYEAMELDGGGSATMVLDDEIMNNPSDGTGERHVANSLLFFWNEYNPDVRYPQVPDWTMPALRPD